MSPNFDQLAKEGILFSNFYANSVKTSRSAISSLLGIPSDISTTDGANQTDLSLISIADILKKNGYHTGYFHNGPLQFENQLEFFTHHGFQTIAGRNELLSHFPHAPLMSWGIPDEYLMQFAVDWLKKKSSPAFLTLFTITNHHPWKIPENYVPPPLPSDLKPAYKRFLQTFHYSDYALGLFMLLLKRNGLSKNTVLFILGDHGQPMGEHDFNFIEQRSLYEENVHVPLLIYADGCIEKPKIIDDVGSQIDLIPTVMDLLNIKGVNHSVGSSLLRKNEKRKVFFHNPYVFGFFGMREGPYKFIHTRSTQELELYNLQDDPDEKKNIADLEVERTHDYLGKVKAYEKFFKRIYDNKKFAPKSAKELTCTLDFSKEDSIAKERLIHSVEKWPYLLNLNLSTYTKLSDELLAKITKSHPELQKLILSECSTITDSGLENALEHCPSLHYLDLSSCLLLTNNGILKAIRSCIKLEELHLKNLDELNENFFENLKEKKTSLLTLNLRGSPNLSDRSIEMMVQSFPNIQHLKLSCDHLTDQALRAIAKEGQNLKDVTFYDCLNLSNDGIKSLFFHLPNLEKLSLNHCPQVSDQLFAKILTSSLMRLHLKDIAQLSDEGLKEIAKLPLRVLSIQNCPKITDKGIEFVKQFTKTIKCLAIDGVSMISNLQPLS